MVVMFPRQQDFFPSQQAFFDRSQPFVGETILFFTITIVTETLCKQSLSPFKAYHCSFGGPETGFGDPAFTPAGKLD